MPREGEDLLSKKWCKVGNPVNELLKPSVHPYLALNF